MIAVISLWSHGLAALLFAALALSQLRYWRGDPPSLRLIIAFAVTSAWAVSAAVLGPTHVMSLLLSSTRTFAFLSFMYALLRTAEHNDRQSAVKVVYFTVAAVIGLQITVTGTLPRFEQVPFIHTLLISTAHMLGITVAAGCLVLVHNIYAQAAHDSRWSIRLSMIGLAGMWVYDLHLNTLGYLSGGPVDDLYAMHGAILAMLVPVFALGARNGADWKIRLSRAATFQSISALAILTYLLLMMSATRVLEMIGGQWVRIGQLGLVFAMSLAALILLPSGKARAWLRVMVVKHLFQHRYDYREEWLGFTRTMGVGGENVAPIEDRVVKAIADIGDSPAALLVVPDSHYRLTPSAGWNWPEVEARSHSGEAEFARFLEATGHIVEFGSIRGGKLHLGGHPMQIPDWMTADGLAWAGVPLIHNDRLVGLVLLAHPLVRRPLDWEDFDLFRTAGKQAASYLAEARSHHALADALRFDEFNRRFAFIMHDIKNLVSQISLVARNVERHADNPEFRADMVATLQSSVKKMNDLLARLSRGNAAEAQPSVPVSVHPLVASIVEVKRRAHPVDLAGETWLAALADRGRLEQALAHLVQNAIDASPPDMPVQIGLSTRDGEVAVEIADRGSGMSAEFIRTRLFQPFASTKEGGFGIGAYEARTLITDMGGRLEVESREGGGSRFTIFLPAAEDSSAQTERMRA
jgi:putative PEP-CTERM system histidine kinase